MMNTGAPLLRLAWLVRRRSDSLGGGIDLFLRRHHFSDSGEPCGSGLHAGVVIGELELFFAAARSE